MTKSGQTYNYQASDHLCDLKKYLGREPEIILINDGRPADNILQWYRQHQEKPVINDLDRSNFSGKIVSGNLINNNLYKKNKADRLTRTILRHDPKKLAKLIYSQI